MWKYVIGILGLSWVLYKTQTPGSSLAAQIPAVPLPIEQAVSVLGGPNETVIAIGGPGLPLPDYAPRLNTRVTDPR
jgi:hypothetical protein